MDRRGGGKLSCASEFSRSGFWLIRLHHDKNHQKAMENARFFHQKMGKPSKTIGKP
jgi:hypothetical protein